MLHGFNASTGVENFAFIPNSVITSKLRSYASPDYEHNFFVDGELTAADVYTSGGSGAWKTILVGTLGRGGPGIFALDVTDPTSVEFLWERNAADTGLSTLGRNIGKPVIAQVANGDWRVILGNGPDNTGGNADLIMIRISDGDVTTVSTNTSGNNALTAVYTWDSDADGFVDTAYAGDLKGNVWRFTDLAAATPQVTKLFQAVGPDSNVQPIMAAPLVARDPLTGNRWVFFGTGKYLNSTDTSDQSAQSWYGIIDPETVTTGPIVSGRMELKERKILAEGSINGFAARVIESASTNDLSGKSGWYIDLISPGNLRLGERMVTPNLLQAGALIGTTRTPDTSDICRPSGTGFVMAIDPFSGARLRRTFFDFTLDASFDQNDRLLVDGEYVAPSGIGFASAPNNPVFIENVMQTSLDDGSVKTILTAGGSVEAKRTSWQEIWQGKY